MKFFKPITFVLLFLGFIANSQEKDIFNFYMTGSILNWEKQYFVDVNQKAIINHLRKTGYIQNIQLIDNKTIVSRIKDLPIEYEESNVNTLYIYADGFLSAFLTITKNSKGYQIHIKDFKMRFRQNYDQITPLPLENYILRNGNFKRNFVKKSSLIFEYTFDKYFGNILANNIFQE